MDSATIDPNEAQRVTIESYDNYIDEYVQKRAQQKNRTLAYWPGVEFFLEQLNTDQVIFEIGSGVGADAGLIEEEGYKVVRSDVADGFVKFLKREGHNPVKYNVLSGPLDKKYDAIFSNAVLLHLNEVQLGLALTNIRASLTNTGILCAGIKLGNFEGWRSQGLGGKRYFKFWDLTVFKEQIKKSGLKVIDDFVTPLNDYAIITCQKI